jgi:hypothetical protein
MLALTSERLVWAGEMDAHKNKTAASGPTFLNMGLLTTGFRGKSSSCWM